MQDVYFYDTITIGERRQLWVDVERPACPRGNRVTFSEKSGPQSLTAKRASSPSFASESVSLLTAAS